MATAAKTYVVEDAENSSNPKAVHTPYPGTLAGLLDALRRPVPVRRWDGEGSGHSRGDAAEDHPQV
jgi:hypothetical protein